MLILELRWWHVWSWGRDLQPRRSHYRSLLALWLHSSLSVCWSPSLRVTWTWVVSSSLSLWTTWWALVMPCLFIAIHWFTIIAIFAINLFINLAKDFLEASSANRLLCQTHPISIPTLVSLLWLQWLCHVEVVGLLGSLTIGRLGLHLRVYPILSRLLHLLRRMRWTAL